MRAALLLLPALLLIGVLPMPAFSDEGMWLLNEPPRERLRTKYQFDLTDDWLTHARLASIRFTNGGSGSFVSANGLIVTNHHIGADSIQKLSTPERNILRDGFLARVPTDELKCPDLELNVLEEIIDVTERVNAAVKPEMTPTDANAARKAVMATIEKDAKERSGGQRCEIVTLYQGGAYHLYRYRRYTDVRLVFAPEQQIAFFGGDTDNFEYPRFNLDVCFFRAYEQDKPAKPSHWLTWSPTGPKDGDLVFVTGHPGTTNRQETIAKLKHRRDVTLPYNLARLRSAEATLLHYGDRGTHEALQAATDLHRVANARKAFSGQYQGLLDPAILRRKLEEQREFVTLASENLSKAELAELAEAEQRIADAQHKLATFEKEFSLFERGDAFQSELYFIARHILRLVTELPKANAERLREYRDSALDSLYFQLYSPAPIYPELERVKLGQALTFLCETLGGEHPLVVRLLAGKPPYARAEELIAGTKLRDPAERKRLVAAGGKGVDDSRDALIVFARSIDNEARSLRKRYEDEVEEVERQAYATLARAKFRVLGKTIAPDATFTLRLAYGVVRGYSVGGVDLPYCTTFGGLFEKAAAMRGKETYLLPPRWLDAQAKLGKDVPFNFVSTADTIGGNSGSPVLNRAGELVGINFDRNRHGLVRNFVYTDEQARHIAVHSVAVIEALRVVYSAEELLRELGIVR